jgi:hypothetical protein
MSRRSVSSWGKLGPDLQALGTPSSDTSYEAEHLLIHQWKKKPWGKQLYLLGPGPGPNPGVALRRSSSVAAEQHPPKTSALLLLQALDADRV